MYTVYDLGTREVYWGEGHPPGGFDMQEVTGRYSASGDDRRRHYGGWRVVYAILAIC